MEFTQQSMQKHKSTYIITQTANLQFHHPSPYKICTQTHKQQAQAHSCTQFTSFNLIYIYIYGWAKFVTFAKILTLTNYHNE